MSRKYIDGNYALCTRHFDDNKIIIIIIYFIAWLTIDVVGCWRVDRTAGREFNLFSYLTRISFIVNSQQQQHSNINIQCK